MKKTAISRTKKRAPAAPAAPVVPVPVRQRWPWLAGAVLLLLGAGLGAGLALWQRPGEEEAPEGMVWVPGGEFSMGSDEFPDARPVHRVRVSGFWMDATEVTNDQFAAFVAATGYQTIAERQP